MQGCNDDLIPCTAGYCRLELMTLQSATDLPEGPKGCQLSCERFVKCIYSWPVSWYVFPTCAAHLYHLISPKYRFLSLYIVIYHNIYIYIIFSFSLCFLSSSLFSLFLKFSVSLFSLLSSLFSYFSHFSPFSLSSLSLWEPLSLSLCLSFFRSFAVSMFSMFSPLHRLGRSKV